MFQYIFIVFWMYILVPFACVAFVNMTQHSKMFVCMWMSFKLSWKLNTHGIYSQNEFKLAHVHSDLQFRFKVGIDQYKDNVSSLCNSNISKL